MQKVQKKDHFAKKCTKRVPVYNIESEEELEEISVVRIQAVKERAVFAEMLVKQRPIRFQIDCGASANILPLRYAEGEELAPCSQTLVMWNGTKVKPVGTCALLVVNPRNNEKFKVRFVVVKKKSDAFAWFKHDGEDEAVNYSQREFRKCCGECEWWPDR